MYLGRAQPVKTVDVMMFELQGRSKAFRRNHALTYNNAFDSSLPMLLQDFAKFCFLVHSRHCLLSSTQTVETLNCTIERTETPPYFRLTSLRKASSNSESNMLLTSSRQDLNALGNEGVMKGTIHTKRHSQQDASDQQREG